MKKKLFIALTVFALLLSLLAGCGGSAKSSDAAAAAPQMMDMSAEGVEEEAAEDYGYAGSAAEAPAAAHQEEGAKIIYTADMELETTDFDGAVEALARLTEECGGYYESSRQSNGGSYRSASYTVRVPAEQYRPFLTQAGALCHLLELYEYTEDVSEVYYDTAGRLETQQTKLARLQELLRRAESMEDIIALESAIAETEEQIDRLSGELRHYDAQVDYSTVNIYLEEVYRLSNVEEPAQGFGSRLAAALKSGLNGFVSGMESLAIALAYGWLWLALLAAAAVIVVLLVRRARKRRAAARAACTAAPPAPPAAYTQPQGKEDK